MGTGVGATAASATPPSAPTTGMRGGLGRTLLTAFLILTTVPLALIGWYAVRQNRLNIETEALQSLQSVAALRAQTLDLWLADREALLQLYVADAGSALSWDFIHERAPELVGAALWETGDTPAWSLGRCAVPAMATDWRLGAASGGAGGRLDAAQVSTVYERSEIIFALPDDNGVLLLCCTLSFVDSIAGDGLVSDKDVRSYLVHVDDLWPLGSDMPLGNAVSVLGGAHFGGPSPASGWYVNHEGVPVIGAYHPLSQTGIGILIEQKQSEILAFNDQIAATLIGGVLAMALVTTAISAIVIRQITRPVIRLTESALVMAEGNLDQYVPVTSRDEIGILTYVFNKMAAELKSLYDDLEGKVVARTRMLQQANYQIQRRAIQLEASLEVSQAVTSIRDPVILLSRVADRIRDRFVYASVAVYLVEPGGGQARLHAVSPLGADWPDRVRTGDGSVMERALRKNAAQVQNQVLSQDSEWYYSRTLARVAVPLRMEERVLGALAVVSTEREVMQEDDLKVLEHLANQVAIALENARAYERERLAALQLEENEAFKARFMANMSHELREPLNSIIGFSRLMLKGFGDPLTDQQREDIQRINANSQHLMDLINDILMITEIQAGLMDLKPRSVDLGNLIESVLPTAGALTRGKPITLAQDIEPGLPPIWGDPDRVRQILVRLLTNAALFTNKGQISLRAWSDDEVVYVSIQDTGVGIPQLDRERIFQGFEKIETGDICSDGPGLGLALSREFVELHGGKMWLESELGKGSTFTFSLPQLRKPEPAATAGDRNQDDAVPAVVAAEERQQRYPDAHASHAPGI